MPQDVNLWEQFWKIIRGNGYTREACRELNISTTTRFVAESGELIATEATAAYLRSTPGTEG